VGTLHPCLCCIDFWTAKHIHCHVRACDFHVKHTYVGDVYKSKKTVSHDLDQLDIKLLRNNRFHPHRIARLVYESCFDNTRAICLTPVRSRLRSRAMCLALFLFVLKVPTLNNPRALYSNPQRLLHKTMQHLETIAIAPFEILKKIPVRR